MYTLRQAEPTDCALIQQLATEAFPTTYRDILTPEQTAYMMEWMYAPENIARQMAEGHTYLLAYDGSIPVGYASIEQQGAHLFHLQKIYVLPQVQGKHCGSFLFREAVAHIKRLHPAPCRMELNVNRHNKALHFYQRMGMTILREGDFPIGNGFFMNDYIMGMEL
ncbi:MAG: GNAT family N-acetyltransferase [Bacteroides sp.]|nr:GNAT family N-acetyltransferase [Bacteroides sp.]